MGELLVDGLVSGTQLRFILTNIQFHTHSEHTINGTIYPLEMYLTHAISREYVHQTNLTKLIINVLFDTKYDEESPLIKQLGIEKLEVIQMLNDI